MAVFRAAAVQLRSGHRWRANADDAERLIRAAAAAGAQYVLTPRNDDDPRPRQRALLAAIGRKTATRRSHRFRAIASELGIHLHIGSMAIKIAPTTTSPIAPSSSGRTASSSRATTRSTCSTSTCPAARAIANWRLYRAGNTATVVDLPWTKIGLTICYDVRFPAFYRTLAKAGAAVLAVPAAFTTNHRRGPLACAVAGARDRDRFLHRGSGAGRHHEDGRDTYGHSMIIDPWGKILAEANTNRASSRRCSIRRKVRWCVTASRRSPMNAASLRRWQGRCV